MFDVGGSELLVIGIVALIVIGPKDLPGMFHTLGRFTAKARSMAREFSRAMDDAAKESGVGDVAKDLKSMTSPKSLGLDKLSGAVDKFEKWDPLKKTPPAKTSYTGPKASGGVATKPAPAEVEAKPAVGEATVAAEATVGADTPPTAKPAAAKSGAGSDAGAKAPKTAAKSATTKPRTTRTTRTVAPKTAEAGAAKKTTPRKTTVKPAAPAADAPARPARARKKPTA